MSALEQLKKEQFWNDFLEYKTSNENKSFYYKQDLQKFVDKAEYLLVVENIFKKQPFPLPQIRELNKKNANKKRTVFVFDRNENYVLKAITYLLNRYDSVFSDNLYSFRKDIGVKKAVADLIRNHNIKAFYSYKVDISDYFNSIDTQMMLIILKNTLEDDKPLYDFISGILTEPFVRNKNEVVCCRKGIMAGMPISGFLANLYLKELDKWFHDRNVIYARYSDDIIVFAETKELIAEYEQKIKNVLAEKKLEINCKKEYRTKPGEPWEFLGFCVDKDGVDISTVSLQKMKDKMRRKAKALVRWKNRSGACNEHAIMAFIKHFNRKFYDNPKQNEVTWCRWYFPTITTAKSLNILDEYMVSYIRYIVTGKHTKANFNLRYEKIKELGYRSLVNSYYCYKKTNLF